MKLAPELRNHIYSLVFKGIDEIPTARSGNYMPRPASAQSYPAHVHYKSIKDLQSYLALPQTSHSIRHECLPMLFDSYIAQHSWLVSCKDNATALFDLTNFIRALTPTTAKTMQLCLLSTTDLDTPNLLVERSFTRSAMNLMFRSSAFADWSAFPCPLPELRLVTPGHPFTTGGASTTAANRLATTVPVTAHGERARGHRDVWRCIPGYIFDSPESDYRLLCAIDQYVLLEGRLAKLEWSSFDARVPSL
jgi:hypothetical protein